MPPIMYGTQSLGTAQGFQPKKPPATLPGTPIAAPPIRQNTAIGQQFKPNPNQPPPINGTNDINSFYNNAFGSLDKGWDAQQGLLQGQANNMMRKADTMNGRMGRGIGGGYAGMQGAAMGQGQNEMQKAWLTYQDQRQGLGKDQFNALTNERQRQEEYQWKLKDDADKQRQHLVDMAMMYGGDTPSNGQSVPTPGFAHANNDQMNMMRGQVSSALKHPLTPQQEAAFEKFMGGANGSSLPGPKLAIAYLKNQGLWDNKGDGKKHHMTPYGPSSGG